MSDPTHVLPFRKRPRGALDVTLTLMGNKSQRNQENESGQDGVSFQDYRVMSSDHALVFELLNDSDHIPTSTRYGLLPSMTSRRFLYKKFPKLMSTWNRWIPYFHTTCRNGYIIGTPCTVCRNGTEPFFTDLSTMVQAAEEFGCVCCGFFVANISLLVQPVDGGVVWENRVCKEESVYILANIVDGRLKEMRLWNSFGIRDDSGEPVIVVLGQFWVELCGINGKQPSPKSFTFARCLLWQISSVVPLFVWICLFL
jgi:hypothetical protein